MSRLRRKLWAFTVFFFHALFVQPFKKLGHLGKSGKTRFLASYGTEGLLPLPPFELAERYDETGCIACGLCDAACEVLARVRRSELVSMSALPLAYSRSPSGFRYAKVALAHLAACEDCGACEAICPTGVPLLAIVRELGEALEREANATEATP